MSIDFTGTNGASIPSTPAPSTPGGISIFLWVYPTAELITARSLVSWVAGEFEISANSEEIRILGDLGSGFESRWWNAIPALNTWTPVVLQFDGVGDPIVRVGAVEPSPSVNQDGGGGSGTTHTGFVADATTAWGLAQAVLPTGSSNFIGQVAHAYCWQGQLTPTQRADLTNGTDPASIGLTRLWAVPGVNNLTEEVSGNPITSVGTPALTVSANNPTLMAAGGTLEITAQSGLTGAGSSLATQAGGLDLTAQTNLATDAGAVVNSTGQLVITAQSGMVASADANVESSGQLTIVAQSTLRTAADLVGVLNGASVIVASSGLVTQFTASIAPSVPEGVLTIFASSVLNEAASVRVEASGEVLVTAQSGATFEALAHPAVSGELLITAQSEVTFKAQAHHAAGGTLTFFASSILAEDSSTTGQLAGALDIHGSSALIADAQAIVTAPVNGAGTLTIFAQSGGIGRATGVAQQAGSVNITASSCLTFRSELVFAPVNRTVIYAGSTMACNSSATAAHVYPFSSELAEQIMSLGTSVVIGSERVHGIFSNPPVSSFKYQNRNPHPYGPGSPSTGPGGARANRPTCLSS